MGGTLRLYAAPEAGFTLLELLVVLAIVALATAGVGFALRDDSTARLERDALRLAALLDAARARSQVTGTSVRWYVTPQGFRFEPEASNTATEAPPREWLDPDTRAVIEAGQTIAAGAAGQTQATSLLLGPDAIIGPQEVVLFDQSKPQQRVVLATDGVRPFVMGDGAP